MKFTNRGRKVRGKYTLKIRSLKMKLFYDKIYIPDKPGT